MPPLGKLEAVTIHHIRGPALLRFVSITGGITTPTLIFETAIDREKKVTLRVLHQFNRRRSQFFQYLPFESRERIAECLLGSFFSSSPILSFLLFFLLSLSFSLSFSPLFFNDSHGMINDSIMFRGTKVNSQPFTAGEKHRMHERRTTSVPVALFLVNFYRSYGLGLSV